MKVMVCLKQVPHQDARLEIREDSTWIKEDNIKFEINSYDTYALEEALRLKDKGEAEVVVVSEMQNYVFVVSTLKTLLL